MPEVKYDATKHPKMLIDLMSQGKLDCHVCGAAGISSDTLYRWIRDNPEFKAAHKLGVQLAEEWWVEQGASGLIPAPIWQRIMTVKFGYAGERTVRLRGLSKAKTYNDQTAAVAKLSRMGIITPGEASVITNTIQTAATINEKTELAKDVAELKELVKK